MLAEISTNALNYEYAFKNPAYVPKSHTQSALDCSPLRTHSEKDVTLTLIRASGHPAFVYNEVSILTFIKKSHLRIFQVLMIKLFKPMSKLVTKGIELSENSL